MRKTTITRIHFQDNGQDFLRWDINEDGQIIGCQPFQESIWSQYKVTNMTDLKKGVRPEIEKPRPEGKPETMQMIHNVARIEKLELQVHTLSGDAESREVYMDGKELDPKPSQKHHNHSPDGFNWGYGGSGPAQLALAVMLRLAGNDPEKLKGSYQKLKFKVLSALPMGKDFEIDLVVDPEKEIYTFTSKIETPASE